MADVHAHASLPLVTRLLAPAPLPGRRMSLQVLRASLTIGTDIEEVMLNHRVDGPLKYPVWGGQVPADDRFVRFCLNNSVKDPLQYFD